MFFEPFLRWLTLQLTTYVSDQAAHVAAALEPAIVSLAAVYVMVWGWLHLKGAIEEPILEGAKRLLTLAVVLGVCLRLWGYHETVVASFLSGPRELGAALLGGTDPLALVDRIWERGGAVGDLLWSRGGVLSGDIGFYIAGAFVWLLMGALCVYVAFLICLSQIAIAVLLALGPLFIVMLLFQGTERFFESWLAQLVNYALVTVLTVLIAALLLQVVDSYATQTAARGAALVTVDALHLLLATSLVLLVLRQVLPMAAGLARGIALSTQGVISRAIGVGLGRAPAALGIAAATGRGLGVRALRLGQALRGRAGSPTPARMEAPWRLRPADMITRAPPPALPPPRA